MGHGERWCEIKSKGELKRIIRTVEFKKDSRAVVSTGLGSGTCTVYLFQDFLGIIQADASMVYRKKVAPFSALSGLKLEATEQNRTSVHI